jgi:fibro-slime domain-containing protein
VRAAALAIVAAACGPTAPVAEGPDAAGPVDPDAREWNPPPPGDGGPGCNVLPVTVRDFRIAHPDFEHFTSDAVTTGLVLPALGADGTPTYAHAGPTICTTGPDEFADWYHDVAGTNQTVATTIALAETDPGVYVYDSSAFFPVDGEGFGNEGMAHNFAFTTEIHTSFRYDGGETFTFRGDDDLWLFINGTLALDLGGLHQPATGTVDLDAQAAALGISPGNSYPMDIFQAERHTVLSNFRIETTIECFVIP